MYHSDGQRSTLTKVAAIANQCSCACRSMNDTDTSSNRCNCWKKRGRSTNERQFDEEVEDLFSQVKKQCTSSLVSSWSSLNSAPPNHHPTTTQQQQQQEPATTTTTTTIHSNVPQTTTIIMDDAKVSKSWDWWKTSKCNDIIKNQQPHCAICKVVVDSSKNNNKVVDHSSMPRNSLHKYFHRKPNHQQQPERPQSLCPPPGRTGDCQFCGAILCCNCTLQCTICQETFCAMGCYCQTLDDGEAVCYECLPLQPNPSPTTRKDWNHHDDNSSHMSIDS